MTEAAAESLPAATRRAAARALLDGLGVMLAASGTSRDVLPFVELALAQGGAAEASVLGFDARVPAPAAAFANGAMAHALDFEDGFDAAPLHPDASLLPAVLAVAQSRPAVSGAELLSAIAIGCDLNCRLALSLRQPLEQGGWYPPPILGAFGAVAAVGRLLGLDRRQLADAFSLALCQLSVPGEIKHSRDTVLRAVREAFPARAAVEACLLAARGVRGFEAPFEGRDAFFRLFAGGRYDANDLLGDLGEHYWIERLTFKRWPSCRGTHAYIEAVQSLRANHRFEAGDVVAAVAEVGAVQRMLIDPLARKRRPATAIDAKFSLPFTIASALLRDDVTLDSFDAAALTAADCLELAGRVSGVERPDWGRDRAASGAVALALRDGRELRCEIGIPVGAPERPLDDGALVGKFVDCVARARRPIPSAQARPLAVRILGAWQETDALAALAPSWS